MNERELSLFKLLSATDIGAIRFFRLLDKFGDTELILKASKRDLMSVEGIGQAIADTIFNSSDSGKAEKELETAIKNNIKITFYYNSDYPKPLRDFADKPLILYIKGNILEKDFDSISIVGSRRISNYGKTVTSEFASYFAKKGITIVSGLARGVDSQAHITALENKSRTIAVLGNGLLVNYPPENAKLQEKISQCGAVISELQLRKQPDRGTFPRRNRIIAGFSRATLLTEAALKSGALITARFCAEYGKDVFAVPGSIYSSISKGTNELIQNGAFIALGPHDMADQLKWTSKDKISKTNKLPSLDKLELEVLSLIENDSAGLPPDLIAQKLNIGISEIAPVLLKLEINGLIKTTPGQIYVRAY
ncbi:DNA-processing protein DprA [Candidatus Endomicrobiellum trichonymphae]|uniref:DNA-processing protein DprA n=1 Tax=Endomicrobium trichonymphae TaxID=1408204 RepID=UPI0008656AF1|nr:DNA-processing protein DprA [Candidatus Endomicrobium trichonymphae]BAV59215.1 DNA processing protein DprA-like [Candidatus Endomicrobium trichonymphae]